MRTVIGFTGKARHGKDTATAELVRTLDFKRYAFADQLKSMAIALDPIVGFQDLAENGNPLPLRLSHVVVHEGWEEAKKATEIRRFLQKLGTEAVRNHIGEDSWINALDRKITQDDATRIAISDVRFPNECRYIQEDLQGEVWRIERTNADGSPYDNGVGDAHVSEALIDELPVDQVISAYTIEELRDKVAAAGDELLTDLSYVEVG